MLFCKAEGPGPLSLTADLGLGSCTLTTSTQPHIIGETVSCNRTGDTHTHSRGGAVKEHPCPPDTRFEAAQPRRAGQTQVSAPRWANPGRTEHTKTQSWEKSQRVNQMLLGTKNTAWEQLLRTHDSKYLQGPQQAQCWAPHVYHLI